MPVSASRIASSIECVTRIAAMPLWSTKFRELLVQHQPRLRIERAERLVEQQDVRLHHQQRRRCRRAGAFRRTTGVDTCFRNLRDRLRQSPGAPVLHARAALRRATSRPNATFSITLSHGNRLKACQTVAMAGRLVILSASQKQKHCRATRRGSRAQIWSRVLLPHPLGPMMAVTFPASNRHVVSDCAASRARPAFARKRQADILEFDRD